MTRQNPFKRAWIALRGFGFKQWFLLVLNVVLVVASLASLAGLRLVSGTLSTLSAAERFQGESETRFSQLACFLPVDQGKTEEDIQKFRLSLDGTLTEQSLEAPENGSLYLDAYSGSASVTVKSEGGGSASVKAVGVGGDFFYFHPLFLRSGSYIRSDDLMDDLVLLDEEMAWRLFGGTDLTGLTVYLNNEPFVISGVVSREDDFATQKAYAGDGGVYLSYSALQRLVESASIDCYEIVMPNPIRNFAKGIVQDSFSDGEVVENTGRFSLERLGELLRSFAGRSMRLNGIIYPYWENAARLVEDYAALLLVLTVIFALCPLGFLTVIAVREIRRACRFVKTKVPEKVESAVEKRREERLEQKFNEQRTEEPAPEQREEE